MARRPTPEEILSHKPHIVQRYYNDKGQCIGWIDDSFVVKTQAEVDAILKELGKIWGESCAGKERERLAKERAAAESNQSIAEAQ